MINDSNNVCLSMVNAFNKSGIVCETKANTKVDNNKLKTKNICNPGCIFTTLNFFRNLGSGPIS